jgi:hypothetical protein
MERYTYHPLPPGERRIRLLQLLPGSGSDDIQCDIVNYTINIERPFGMYEALSYCWGDPGNPRRIQVKNQGDAAFRYLDVTANLFEGLKRLRDPDMPRMMWIDAICICQSDLEERGQQVGFMATIYAMASQVVVWLGAGSEDDHAFHDHYEAFGTMRHTSKSPMDIPSHVSGAIRKLVRSEWFTRVWVSNHHDVVVQIIVKSSCRYCKRSQQPAHSPSCTAMKNFQVQCLCAACKSCIECCSRTIHPWAHMYLLSSSLWRGRLLHRPYRFRGEVSTSHHSGISSRCSTPAAQQTNATRFTLCLV